MGWYGEDLESKEDLERRLWEESKDLDARIDDKRIERHFDEA